MAISVIDWRTLPFSEENLRHYLAALYGSEVQEVAVYRFEADEDKEESLKEFGYGNPLLVEFTRDGQEERLVFHTMSEDAFGHERPSDRARNLLLDHATFNKLPRHAPSVDVGAFTAEGTLLSLGQAQEFFHISRYVPGRPYAQDLKRIATTDDLQEKDEGRLLALADYLAQIHALKKPDAVRYHRCIRDLLGHGEGIMGMLDSYPADYAPAPPTRLEAIEKKCITWRWRIKKKHYRLSQVHGDFHPWNVLFEEDDQFMLLDRSRGAWGEPADDVSAMTINFILFSVQQHGTMSGAFGWLFDLFWERYLEKSGDEEMMAVIAPFYAWRALVLAHPLWYPDLSRTVRAALLRFVENVLDSEKFDPHQVSDYLAGEKV